MPSDNWLMLWIAFASALIAASSSADSSEATRSLTDLLPIVLAQAGSTGGAIGKQNKSISGGEDQPAEPALVQPSPNEAERAWAIIKDTTSPGVLQAYIKQFGSTVYSNMARARLRELQAAAPLQPTTAAQPPMPQRKAVATISAAHGSGIVGF